MNDKKKLGWDVLEAGGIGHDRIGWWVFVKGIWDLAESKMGKG